MRNYFSRQVLIFGLCLTMLLGMMTVVSAGTNSDYDFLDLSASGATALQADETTQLVVKGVVGTMTRDSEAVISPADVTFASSNEAVASVDETGLVTAHRAGMTTITASYDGLSQSIVVLVGTNLFSEGYEGESTSHTTTLKRSGEKSYKQTMDKIRQAKNNKASLYGGDKKYIGACGAHQFWFYDDNMPEKFSGRFEFNIVGNPNRNVYVGQEWWGSAKPGYTIAAFSPNTDKYNNKSYVARSTGWHQVTLYWDRDNIDFYVDGQIIGSLANTIGTDGASIENTALWSSPYFYYSGTGNDDQCIYFDDFVSLNTYADPQVTVSVGENGIVKNAGADVADGSAIDVISGNDLVLDIAPNENYEATATVDGEPASITNNQLVLSNVTKDHTVSVSFRKTASKIIFSVGEHGTVSCNGSAVVTGNEIIANVGDEVTVSYTPDQGYQLSSVKYGDNPLVDNQGNVTFTVVDSDQTVTILFESIPVTKPSFTAGTVHVSDGYAASTSKPEGYQTAVIYYKLTKPELSIPTSWGIYFKNDQGEQLTLAADSSYALSEFGAFGIRVYGDAIVAGTYQAQPWVTFQGSAEPTTAGAGWTDVVVPAE